MKLIGKLVTTLLILLISTALFIVSMGWYVSEPGYEGPATDHFNGETFENPGNVPVKSFMDVMKWYVLRDQGEWKPIPESEVIIADKPEENVTKGMVITM